MSTISADLSSGFRVELRSGDHTWYADEPESLGGTDTGPGPYEMLLGSLGACTLITISMIATREKIPVDNISARFEYERIHGDDCAKCDEAGKPYLHEVTTHIFIDGDFTDEQKRRLERVVTRCPVHRTLEDGVVFDENIHIG